MMNMYVALIAYAIVFYVGALAKKTLRVDQGLRQVGRQLMTLPRIVLMVLMAIPEQMVLMQYEPMMPLANRLMVSVAMYVIHFAYNGMVMKPLRSYDELAWILGTAYYAYQVIGVRRETAIALVAADAVMTLSLRGMA